MVCLELRGLCLALACAGAVACTNADTVGWTNPGSGGAGAASGGSAGSSGGMGVGAAESARIAARIRRLTNTEYDATVQALLGTKQSPAVNFVPDARQFEHGKFERNDEQVVEPMLARQLQQAAEALANEYVTSTLPLALPCLSQADAACARTFFEGFLPRAYRRAIAVSELDALLGTVVLPAIARDGFRPAIALGIEAALQTTAFLYHTELGASPPNAASGTMTNAEIAAAISYLLTGGPPDGELSAGPDLVVPGRRGHHARRLLTTNGARLQVRRMVKQWLDIDQIATTKKSLSKFPNFAPDMFERESDAFIDEVVFARNGDFTLLMSAEFSVGHAELAEFYGAPPPSASPGLIDLRGLPRRGILNRGAFLATYATPELPSPVKRGARFITQALCIDPGDPNALNLRVALPPLDSTKTTRERFQEHSQGVCRGCHDMIDSVGFTFQHFNAIGAWEASEDQNTELPIDSSATLALPADIPFAGRAVEDSAELVALLSESEAGRRCFARNLARFTAATHGRALEQGFIEEWERLARAGQDSVQELLVAYVESKYFVEREPNRGAP